MSKIRQSAKGETCTFNLPGVCNHNPETTVLCHAPHPGKGMGIKGPDTWAAYGCSSCHDEMDGRTWNGKQTRVTLHKWAQGFNDWPTAKVRILFWFGAICETQRRLIKKGLMPK